MRTSPLRTSLCCWVRVPANSESAARNRYRHFLQRSLSCVSKAVLRPAQPDLSRDSWLLVCPTDPIQFKTKSGLNLLFSFEQGFHHGAHPDYPGEYKIFTDFYIYRVRFSEKPEDALFAWHWHPTARPECHIHIGAPHATATDLHRKHVPAGRVAFEEILLFLIREMDVVPLKESWQDDLGDSLTRFEIFRSWTGSRKPEDSND